MKKKLRQEMEEQNLGVDDGAYSSNGDGDHVDSNDQGHYYRMNPPSRGRAREGHDVRQRDGADEPQPYPFQAARRSSNQEPGDFDGFAVEQYGSNVQASHDDDDEGDEREHMGEMEQSRGGHGRSKEEYDRYEDTQQPAYTATMHQQDAAQVQKLDRSENEVASMSDFTSQLNTQRARQHYQNQVVDPDEPDFNSFKAGSFNRNHE